MPGMDWIEFQNMEEFWKKTGKIADSPREYTSKSCENETVVI